MSLTNDGLKLERVHFDGVQRLYEFNEGWGLRCVNAPMLHSFPFAWEIAVLRGGCIDYNTPLTSDVEVFITTEEANEFITKAVEYFRKWSKHDRAIYPYHC